MYSYINNYCGKWKDVTGNLLGIEPIDDTHVSVTYVRSGDRHPMLRPWIDGMPATGMIGSYDPGFGPSLDIELSHPGTGFCLSLDFDLLDGSYTSIMPSIIRNEEDEHLEKYYDLFRPLSQYTKCL